MEGRPERGEGDGEARRPGEGDVKKINDTRKDNSYNLWQT